VLTAPAPAAFADGIIAAAADPARRRRLAARGKRRIAETYNFEVFTRRLGECYTAVLGDAAP
jgi:glycosyltransferase involved in cell wall biosynthesis